jgi:hypothetical protein
MSGELMSRKRIADRGEEGASGTSPGWRPRVAAAVHADERGFSGMNDESRYFTPVTTCSSERRRITL